MTASWFIGPGEDRGPHSPFFLPEGDDQADADIAARHGGQRFHHPLELRVSQVRLQSHTSGAPSLPEEPS
jgi:hypothetical protein